MAEEIFQSGILPSDTDFRIFRDYGGLPGELASLLFDCFLYKNLLLKGLDMAQISNGYVYHTIFDNVQAVPIDSLQSSGENALSLVQAFANASEMRNPEVSHSKLLGQFRNPTK